MGTVRLGKRTEGRSPLIKDFVPLASLDDVVFGGWDIFEDNSYEAAKTAGVLEGASARSDPARARGDQADAGGVRSPLRQAARRPERQEGQEQARCSPISCARTCGGSRQRTSCDRLVMVWCGSTEVYLTESPAHATLAAFEKALEANDDNIPSSMIYAYAAIKEGIPYANAAPNLSADVPGAAGAGRHDRLAARRQGSQDRTDADQDDHRARV